MGVAFKNGRRHFSTVFESSGGINMVINVEQPKWYAEKCTAIFEVIFQRLSTANGV